jgi:hypothetical protein
MTEKKTENKTAARPRLSLAARLLGDAVRVARPATSREEPWRDIKLQRKNGSRR